MFTHPFAHEIVGQVSRQNIHGERLSHPLGVHLKIREYMASLMQSGGFTSNVPMTPSAIRRHEEMVSTVSNRGSLSSCRSLL